MTETIWGQPAPLDRSIRPEFPVDALPKVMRDLAIARAAELQCDPALVVGAMLPVVAAACGAAYIYPNRHGWIEPAPVWTMTLADPGSRKSAALSTSISALNAAQREAIEEDAKTRRSKNVRLTHAEKQIAKAELAMSALLDADEPPTDAEIDAAASAVDAAVANAAHVRREVGSAPLISMGGFATSEKFHDDLAAHKNVLSYVAEGDTYFKNLAEGKLDQDVYLQGWSMETHERRLVSREVKIAENPSLHHGVTVQPAVVERVLRGKGQNMLDTGLFDRFLVFVIRDDQLQRTDFDDLSNPQPFTVASTKSREEFAFHDMIRMEVARSLPLKGEPTRWVFSAGVASVQKALHAQWAGEKHRGALGSAGAFAKLAGQALRLARVFAQVEMTTGVATHIAGAHYPVLDTSKHYPITEEALIGGWKVVRWCYENHEYVFGGAMTAEIDSEQFLIRILKTARRLADGGRWAFTTRDLRRSGMARYMVGADGKPDAAKLTSALNVLVQHGWFAAAPGAQANSVTYATHPEIVRWLKEFSL